jgi:hypothetical protein
LGQEEEV